MIKKVLIIIGFCFFLLSCVDKKPKENTNKLTDEKQEIESVTEEINQDLKSLENEAKEIEKDLSELDKL